MNFFQRCTLVTFFLLATIAQIPTAFADDDSSDLAFVASLGFQDKKLSFDQKYSGLAANDAEFSVHLPTANISFTTAYKRLYLALKLEKSIVDTSTTTDETDRSSLGNANLIAYPGSEVDVSREDKSITLGYNVWRKLNLFVGYLQGETELKPNPFCANPFSGCTQANYAFLQYYLGQPDYKQTYTEEGPYIGLSYAWQIAEAGSLSASFAYATMNGQYVDNASDPTGFFGGDFQAFDYRGDTDGTSIGLTWSAPLGETSSYFIDLRSQKYSMDGADKTGGPNAGTFVKTEETMQGITAGLQFFF